MRTRLIEWLLSSFTFLIFLFNFESSMRKLEDARTKVRGELEAPPALRRFGSGWISGTLGLVLGVAGVLLVISLLAPGLFSIPETQNLRSNPWYRVGIHFTLIAAFAFSVLSLILRK